MTETNEKEQKYVSIGKAAEYLGVSKDTLRRWEKAGKIVCHRTPGDRRRYLKEDLDKVLEGGVAGVYSEKSPESVTSSPEESKLTAAASIIGHERAKPEAIAPKPVTRTPPRPPQSQVRPQQPGEESAKEKQNGTRISFINGSKEAFRKIFKSKEKKERGNLPTHYISTPAGPRRINIRKPKLSTFTNKFTDKLRFINIHTLIFISVLVTTAIATILIFYMLFQGEAPERIEVPKVKIPKIRDEAKGRILSPIP